MAALDYGTYSPKQYYKVINDYGTAASSSNIYVDYGTSDTTTCGSTWKTHQPTWTTTASTDTSSWSAWGKKISCYEDWYESARYDADRLYVPPKKTPEQKLKEIMSSRQAPAVHTRERWRLHRSKQQCPDEREARARQTLRRVIGEEKYRSFLINGFVTVRNPKSGLSFQIFPGHGITCVFDKGKMVDRLCVVLNGDFPPTDSIIMRYLMILNNEEQFRSIAVKWDVQKREKKIITADDRSLTEIFEELKAVA
jgi:hypothetical protein